LSQSEAWTSRSAEALRLPVRALATAAVRRAQHCGRCRAALAAVRSISAVDSDRSALDSDRSAVDTDRSAVDFPTAVRSSRTAVRSIFTPYTAVDFYRSAVVSPRSAGAFYPAVRSANTAQGDRSAVEFPRTATSPSSRAPPSCFEPPSYIVFINCSEMLGGLRRLLRALSTWMIPDS